MPGTDELTAHDRFEIFEQLNLHQRRAVSRAGTDLWLTALGRWTNQRRT